MLFVCPSCGHPDLFERGFEYFFLAQPAIPVNQADHFAQWVAALPEDLRPQTAAYPTLDDPFVAPVVESIREQLEAVGVKTEFAETPYPEGTSGAAMDAIANGIKESGADLVAHGAIGTDGIDLVRSMQAVDYNPRILFQTAAPALGDRYSEGVGVGNTEGIMYAVSWSPHAATEVDTVVRSMTCPMRSNVHRSVANPLARAPADSTGAILAAGGRQDCRSGRHPGADAQGRRTDSAVTALVAAIRAPGTAGRGNHVVRSGHAVVLRLLPE